MTRVRGTVVYPNTDTPVIGAHVEIRAIGSTTDPSSPAFVPAASAEIFSPYRTAAGAQGEWHANLVPSDDLDPTGSLYSVTYRWDGDVHAFYIDVPDAAEVWVGDITTPVPDQLVGVRIRDLNGVTITDPAVGEVLGIIDVIDGIEVWGNIAQSGGGGGSALTVKSNGSVVDAAVTTLDYSSQFGATESPSHEINLSIVSLAASIVDSGTFDAARIPDLSGLYDLAGAAAAAQAASQPLDSDLTAIAALATTAYGRSFLTLADASAARTLTGSVIGTDVQAFDSDLAAIAALSTTAYGRGFLPLADASAALSYIGTYSSTAIDSLIAAAAAGAGKRGRVRAATTANITIATALNNGDTLDGVSLITGDLVLVKDQSAPAENGVYVVGVSPARSADFDTWTEFPGSLISVAEGTANADGLWICTSNEGGTLGVTAITFARTVITGELLAANNLSDLISPATARGNLGLAIGTNVQAFDADLDAVAALGSTGIAVRTAANTWAQRSVAVSSAGGIAVANGDGVAGNPTLSLDADLEALAALSTTGIVARTAAATYVPRTIASGTAITVTNGDGVAGAPSIAVSDAELLAIAGLTSAADRVPYFTGAGTAALATFGALGRSLVAGTRDTFNNADKTVAAGTSVLAQIGTMSTVRTVTLPAASAYTAGSTLLVVDESGTVVTGSASITIARAGADTISGATLQAIVIPYGYIIFESDGVSKWTIVMHSSLDHGGLQGLADDDHTQYPNAAHARTGDQTFEWSSSSSANAIYRTTSHATKGKHIFGSPVVFGTVAEALAPAVVSTGADVVSTFGQVFALAASDFATQTGSRQWHCGAAATTNATTTTAATIPIATDSMCIVKATIVARRTDEASGAVYERKIIVRNAAGTVTVDQAVSTVGTDYEAVAGWDATLDVSGTNVRARVTGAAATNLDWCVVAEITSNTDA